VKLSRIAQLGAVAAVAALTLTACAANEGATTAPSDTASAGPALTGTLVGQGASSQQVAIQAWTAAFNQTNPDVVLNYDPAGSGTGREFLAGAINFAGSDRAFKVDEIAAGGFGACAADSGIVEIPAYISPIAIIFNVPGVDSLNLDAKTVAGSSRAPSRSGTTRPSPRTTPARPSPTSRSTPCTAPTSRARRALHRLPVGEREGCLDLGSVEVAGRRRRRGRGEDLRRRRGRQGRRGLDRLRRLVAGHRHLVGRRQGRLEFVEHSAEARRRRWMPPRSSPAAPRATSPSRSTAPRPPRAPTPCSSSAT
jgi:hypothetical protein